MIETDVLIVGAGPIGIEMAVALRRAGVAHEHVEAGAIGQTISWWAPGTVFFSSPERISIAGVPLVTRDQRKATGEEYRSYLRGVVEQFGLRVRTFEKVVSHERQDDGRHRVRTRTIHGHEREYVAKRVVLAVGDMDKPRRLGVEGEDQAHVSHYLQDPEMYYGREVLIVGGKNSAVEAAIRLYRAGARVTISYWREAFDKDRVKYWLLPELEWLIKKGRVGFEPRTEPARIGAGDVELRHVNGGGDGGAKVVDADFVLLLTGYEQDSTLFEEVGVELVGEERKPKLCLRTMETSVPGVHVIGTASAGTQVGGVKVFIETSHVHVERVLAAIEGREGPGVEGDAHAELPES